MVLNDKQRRVGQDNYLQAVQVSRRQFLAGTLVVPTAAAMYFGYEKIQGDPVRVGIIGTGNQGFAHISASNPDFIRFVAFSDIRPSNQKRAWRTFQELYGADAKKIRLYEDYKELLKDPNIEMVIIALPLHLHSTVSIDALRAGKHVLCEKLMAKTVLECKQMVREADKARKLLAIGHQRHYSYLYHNCLSIINREDKDVLGDIRYLRAFWHRNQTGDGAADGPSGKYDGWHPPIPLEDESLRSKIKQLGYDSLEQLVRWRLNGDTGGGLMVELGSHQLDACSIFLGKVHPKSVVGVGVKSYFQDGRAVDDHIFLTYEFPKEVVVTYTSISTNAFDGYGEEVMGTKGTLIVQQEADAYVFKEGKDKDTRINWAEDRISRPTAEGGSTKQWVTSVGKADTLTSRGYREEQEHMAWLIRQPPNKILFPDKEHPFPDLSLGLTPRCHGRIALADAVIALSSNLAMKHKKRIEFKPSWFEAESNDVPETDPAVIS